MSCSVWYQVQPDQEPTEEQDQHEYPSCEFYTVTHSNETSRFVVNTQFELYTGFVDEKPAKYETHSTNYLDVLEEAAKMSYNPPNLSGGQIIESNFTVISTDYESYAVISNCDKEINDGDVQFSQHATLWSRTRDLENDFVDNLYENLGSFDFDPYDLNSVSQTGCIEGATKLLSINLNEQTES
ncbi:uncharacterized protein LOC129576552 [Sitodiplosis mosellana]|uniref:uncharacterized protein LOC129576552 n=1 Tax=Sitodiplosis mosellana TaxID=263140 RepID=UPI0024442298|nr:uncharacterized protein LOC129576552 [Sitodiplosis mosellana]